MGKIFCILGKSGSGKDTVFSRLMACPGLRLKRVVTYTTRPMRPGETDGVEYHFIDNTALESMKAADKMIELRRYDTVHGVWAYFTADDGQLDLDSGNYLMIVTPQAFMSLRAYYGENHVEPLYLVVEDGLRLTRSIAREKKRKSPDYCEMCRRFLSDSADFSQEHLQECGIAKEYDNTDLETCVTRLRDDILRQIKEIQIERETR
jgi:guanylate kinase